MVVLGAGGALKKLVGSRWRSGVARGSQDSPHHPAAAEKWVKGAPGTAMPAAAG